MLTVLLLDSSLTHKKETLKDTHGACLEFTCISSQVGVPAQSILLHEEKPAQYLLMPCWPSSEQAHLHYPAFL